MNKPKFPIFPKFSEFLEFYNVVFPFFVKVHLGLPGFKNDTHTKSLKQYDSFVINKPMELLSEYPSGCFKEIQMSLERHEGEYTMTEFYFWVN